MKFINYLSSISNVSIFPMISLGIFVTFFIGCLIYVFKVDTKILDHMKSVPLED